jgi:hypothetical protein
MSILENNCDRKAYEWEGGLGPHGSPQASGTIQHQDTEFRIGEKFCYADGIPAQYTLGVTRRMRPLSEPYDFGGGPIVVASS